MIEGLVVNGCSYMDVYAMGNGHVDLLNKINLALKLNITSCETIAQSGCSNSRIVRTTLKHSYIAQQKNLYVLGMTFISRNEIPILKSDDPLSFEGRWTNPQNQLIQNRWDDHWTIKDTKRFVSLKLKEEVHSILDRTEDLMYRLLSLIESLQSRGHRVLIYQQADSSHIPYLDNARLKLFKDKKNFINGFEWLAIQWQHEQGIAYQEGDYRSEYGDCSDNIKHRKMGKHHAINKFLTNYIKEHKILE